VYTIELEKNVHILTDAAIETIFLTSLITLFKITLQHSLHGFDLECYAAFNEEFGFIGADQFDVGFVVVVFHFSKVSMGAD
jgi:hypothetical protein